MKRTLSLCIFFVLLSTIGHPQQQVSMSEARIVAVNTMRYNRQMCSETDIDTVQLYISGIDTMLYEVKFNDNHSVLRMEESEMLQSGPMYNVVIKYDGEDSFVFFSDNNRPSLVTKDHPQIDGFDWDSLQMAWFYFHPITFIDTEPYLRMLTSCKTDRDGDTRLFHYESDWPMGKADFMVKTDDFTLYRAGQKTYFWNDVYCFHDISFKDRQHYVDSIMTND